MKKLFLISLFLIISNFAYANGKILKSGFFTKSGEANKLYRKLYVKLYKTCGSRGVTTGGDKGRETAAIASKYFIDNLK